MSECHRRAQPSPTGVEPEDFAARQLLIDRAVVQTWEEQEIRVVQRQTGTANRWFVEYWHPLGEKWVVLKNGKRMSYTTEREALDIAIEYHRAKTTPAAAAAE
jgi:hypothetical protein